MKKTILISLCVLNAISFSSCFVNKTVIDKQTILKKIQVKDESDIGILNYCNFKGKVENKNKYSITNLELKITFYDKRTYVRSFHTVVLETPITACGSATYKDKFFIGRRLELEKVEIVHAEKANN